MSTPPSHRNKNTVVYLKPEGGANVLHSAARNTQKLHRQIFHGVQYHRRRRNQPTFLPSFTSIGLKASNLSSMRTATPRIFISFAPCLSMSTFLNRG